MRELIYSMGVTLDGFVAGPDGDIWWTAPGEELHAFHNERMREIGVHLCGRRLYETMLVWERPDEIPDITPAMLEFAPLWQQTPKVVFSTTLDHAEGNWRLVKSDPVAEVERLKAEDGALLEVGGATLAASVIDLIDEFRLFVYPVTIGAGTPFFPPGAPRQDLQLEETRTFAGGVVYLRYRRAAAATA